MPYIKGYFFETKGEAKVAEATINTGEGIPVNDTDTTRSYCLPGECIGGWYLPFDEVIEKYLGTQVEIELPDPPFPPK